MIIDVGDHYLKWDNNKVDFDDLIEAYERGRWIPCSERLPEKEVRVLVTVKFNGECNMETAEFCGFDIGWVFDNEMYEYTLADYDVIAWQPLPEPYLEK